MSAVISYPQETIDRITLASLLTPMQFRTVLLVACGLEKCDIAELLGTRERVIENALRDIYDRTGCANSGDLVLRYVHEVESGLLELARLRRELEELEARSAQILHGCPRDLLRHCN
jgi:DNA-binding CsgD family transcriptional regulator